MQRLGRSNGGAVGKESLAEDTGRVEDEEGRVSQPRQLRDVEADDIDGEVGVANDLGDGPGEEHGGVGRVEGDLRERVDDEPDDEDAREDLDGCCEEGRANKACFFKS